mmetsp:Transcript_48045/g.89264  ORF Transcript_48045/g.89264 Transcript_48045/m.89264 type:complete len:92 (+) Transcript_48045:2-277(+)
MLACPSLMLSMLCTSARELEDMGTGAGASAGAEECPGSWVDAGACITCCGNLLGGRLRPGTIGKAPRYAYGDPEPASCTADQYCRTMSATG